MIDDNVEKKAKADVGKKMGHVKTDAKKGKASHKK
jgi:hypothetical protein